MSSPPLPSSQILSIADMHAACIRLRIQSEMQDSEQLEIKVSEQAGCGAVDVLDMKFGFMFICTCEPRYSQSELSDVPGYAASVLLATNGKLKVGYWCLAKRSDEFIYEFRHIAHRGSLNDDQLRSIIITMDEEVSGFSNSLREAFSN